MTSVYATPAPATPCGWDLQFPCSAAEWASYPAAVQTNAAEAGAFLVWAGTGRRFGLCPRVIRPCGSKHPASDQIIGYWWSSGSWFPYLWDGVWRNCWSGCGGICSCAPASQVWLGAPTHSITEVLIDGSPLASGSYRVDSGLWLVRTDGQLWPEAQDMSINPPAANTFQVSTLVGTPVPPILLAAAGELALEWAKSCTGQACRLPTRMTSVTRQGISVNAVPLDTLLQSGLTGLDSVDRLMGAFNPGRLPARPRVMSPDAQDSRITTWP